MSALTRVVPTDGGNLALEFRSGDLRLFDCFTARKQHGPPGFDWSGLDGPETFRHLAFDADGVRWPRGGELTADHLFARSRPLTAWEAETTICRVAYRNQAPTSQHPTHHVYAVDVKPFAAKPFLIGESIAGGHGDRGGSSPLNRADLLAWPGWEEHFALSGCGWAVPLVTDVGLDERSCVDAVLREVFRRADTDESDVRGYEAKQTPAPGSGSRPSARG